MPNPDPATGEVRRFSDVLAEFCGGVFDDQLTDELTKATQSAMTLDKPAVVSIKVKVKPEGGGFVLSMLSTVSEPSPDPAARFYFQDPSTGLPTRRDPQQPAIPGLEHLEDDPA